MKPGAAIFRRSTLGAIIAFALLCALAVSSAPAVADNAKKEPGSEFFNDPKIRVFHFDVSEQALMSLRRRQSTYVKGTVREGNVVLTNVGIRLKGMGSFRPVTEKPSFAVKFDEFVEDQEYSGVTKLMFNNSVQDHTYMVEALGTQLFRDAGLPAARVTHARVVLNGRDLGLYVVIEAMNKRFLKQHFTSSKGNLYEAYLADIDSPLEQDNGEPSDRSDLRALLNACMVRDPQQRFSAMSKVLDVNRFIDFTALEILIGHWDGYATHTNNYRIYHDPTSDKMVFITHGLDWAFRRPNISITPPLKSIVGRALFLTPEGERIWRERIGTLYTNVFRLPVITNRMDQLLAKVRSAGLSPREMERVERAAALMRERIQLRHLRVADQLAGKGLPVAKFGPDGTAHPTGWRPEYDHGEPTMDQPVFEGRRTLHTRANNERTHGSWRTQMYLPRGRYRIEGLVRTEALNGATTLRISGGDRDYSASRSSGWRTISYDFEIPEGLDVEFVCDFSASSGDVWYDLDSFRVRKL
jgi:hypothetical protein